MARAPTAAQTTTRGPPHAHILVSIADIPLSTAPCLWTTGDTGRVELRYRLAVVTDAGGGLGRELAIALARRGMSVLAADRDLAAAEQTVALVRASRVVGWPVQVDLADVDEVRLLAARARDLGGADVLVVTAGARAEGPGGCRDASLVEAFLADLAHRRTPDAPAAVVIVGSGEPQGSPGHAASRAGLIRLTAPGGPATAVRARVMAVVADRIEPPRAHVERAALPPLISPAEVCSAVVDLLVHGTAGQVVELAG